MNDAAPLNRYQLAELGSLLAEPARAAMLLALTDGTSRPAGELAQAAGITPATASAHLHRLLAGGLLALQVQGRHRYYRLADERVAAMLESLALARVPALHAMPAKGDAQLRRARCCYRHLAGALGVAFCATLLDRDWLQIDTRGLCLRPAGIEVLRSSGLAVDDAAPLYGRSCLDWTERRMHLGGPLGVALTSAMFEADWLRRLPRGRALQPSADGLRRLGALGVSLD
ncbi:helix-turn-helix transcriptional regulator [Rhodanobacter sp. C01]|uniref:ArsR/SmtB family transcription factor n=1 Tax=Rhodanobacter sp. C01 TaxID=1945856 RepID=UPI00098450E1|nr:helix-turn-helix transcriptional regulator [Rhodanobacter sp. C01]OOG49560.1 transcriptional regulator [Rhodanobacter sp. C01]